MGTLLRKLPSWYSSWRVPPGVRRCQCSCIRHYNIVRPGTVSPTRTVPAHVVRPPYAMPTSLPTFNVFRWDQTKPEIKTSSQIGKMTEACAVARNILNQAAACIEPGITTDEIDIRVHDECVQQHAYPSPLLYKGYPKAVCTSVNNVACHGIPDDRPLESGDIINIDVTVFYNGYHGDLSETYLVGEVDDNAVRLVSGARACRDAAIAICGPGVPFATIGATISKLCSDLGYQVIPNFCGHGIGENFHEPPDIIHIDNTLEGAMQPGMTFTIEPVISEGGSEYVLLEDGWTAVSVDNSRSAQFEHTVLITEHGARILTA